MTTKDLNHDVSGRDVTAPTTQRLPDPPFQVSGMSGTWGEQGDPSDPAMSGPGSEPGALHGGRLDLGQQENQANIISGSGAGGEHPAGS